MKLEYMVCVLFAYELYLTWKYDRVFW